MKKTMIVAILAVALTGCAGTDLLPAVQEKGDVNLYLFGQNINSDTGEYDNGEMLGGIGVGYFIDELLEVGGDVTAAFGETEIYTLGLNVRAYQEILPEDWQTQPYAGAYAGYCWIDGDNGHDDGLVFGPMAGLKTKWAENLASYVEYRYGRYSGDFKTGVDDDAHQVFLGAVIKLPLKGE